MLVCHRHWCCTVLLFCHRHSTVVYFFTVIGIGILLITFLPKSFYCAVLFSSYVICISTVPYCFLFFFCQREALVLCCVSCQRDLCCTLLLLCLYVLGIVTVLLFCHKHWYCTILLFYQRHWYRIVFFCKRDLYCTILNLCLKHY